MDVLEKERRELRFWENSKTEYSSDFTLENIINKVGDSSVFCELVKKYDSLFRNSHDILELGGGQGWASCLIKKLYSQNYVIVSDVSPVAVDSLKYWEDLFKVTVDQSFSCRSYEIPLKDESVDLVFCFAAAHHFVLYKESLAEINRILRRNGKCIFMYEPSCRSYIYPIAYKKVNKKRPEVHEDVIIYEKMKALGKTLGFDTRKENYPSILKRGPKEMIYYLLLNKLTLLQHILPCTANFVFTKN